MFTKFQFASTAFTVTFKDVPAICVVGIPVFPVVVPGAAVSPGINTCNFDAVPAFTVKVAVPVIAEPVTTNVKLLPATIGVTLTPVNTPAVNAAEVPVIPVVPL